MGTFLDREIARSLKDPEYRAAFVDASQRHDAIDALVAHRKRQGLTQTEVARRMGVGQPTVSEFEKEGSDPRLSTMQRYARAVNARCVVYIEGELTPREAP